jgi:hypothetical protein
MANRDRNIFFLAGRAKTLLLGKNYVKLTSKYLIDNVFVKLNDRVFQ